MTKEQAQIALYVVVFIVIAFNMWKMNKNFQAIKKQKEEEEHKYKEAHTAKENEKDPEEGSLFLVFFTAGTFRKFASCTGSASCCLCIIFFFTLFVHNCR